MQNLSIMVVKYLCVFFQCSQKAPESQNSQGCKFPFLMLVSHVLPKKLPNSEHFPHWRQLCIGYYTVLGQRILVELNPNILVRDAIRMFCVHCDGVNCTVYRVIFLTGAPINFLSTRSHVNWSEISLSARDSKGI